MVAPLKTGPWNLSELKEVPKNGLKVFSCFHCGGGSTMGYKLAGYTVLGGVEIDPEMMEIYRANHKPRISYLMGVEEFNKIPNDKLPAELFDLDILDGSPPCSSFSMSGSREKKWGEASKFREGQSVQVLDDLFFHFIETARKLRPKVVVAENVKGLISGNARGYVKEIFSYFNLAGYDCQLFLLNASRMGVPQRRERTVFIARKKSLELPPLSVNFSEVIIPLRKAFEPIESHPKYIHHGVKPLSEAFARWWRLTEVGKSFSTVHPNKSYFNNFRAHPDRPANTLLATSASWPTRWDEPRRFSPIEMMICQTFPLDYNFKQVQAGYVCGMSVPPFMMQRVADQIERQWFSKCQ